MIKQILILGLILLVFINCKHKEEKFSISQNKNELVFKKWLKDTLTLIKKENNLDCRREIILSKDSLSVDIVKTFDKIINSKNQNQIKSKELIYALDLLMRNHDLPKEEFRLKFIISSYYSVSMAEQLNYDYESEIKLFDIIKKNKTEKYKFIKGNLIEKKILKD